MKFGRTAQDKEAARKAKAGRKVVFAIIPRYCYNTKRKVWLENVVQITYFEPYVNDVFYEEII